MAQQQTPTLPSGPATDPLGNTLPSSMVSQQAPPSGGATIGERLSAQNSPHLKKFTDAIKGAIQSNPSAVSKPGVLSKILVGGAIEALGAGLGDAAAASEPAPGGGGALTGIARTLQARGQRVAQQKEAVSKEKSADLLRAETTQRIAMNTRNIYRQDQQDRTAAYDLNGKFIDTMRKTHDVQDNVTQDQLNDMFKKDPDFWKTHTGRAVGEEPVFDGGQPKIVDGKPIMSPLYSIAKTQARDGSDGSRPVTEAESKFYELGGNHVPVGTVLTGAQHDSANSSSMGVHQSRMAIDKANGEEMSSDRSKQLDAILQDPHIQSYIGSNPALGALGGLNQAQKNTQAHIASLDQKIAAVQKTVPQGQQSPVLQQLQQERQRQIEGGQKIEKAISVGFDQKAHEDYEKRLDEQAKEAEIERHNKEDEKIQAAKVKAEKGGFTGNPDARSPQEFLQSLDPEARSIVQQIGEGRAPLNNPGYLLARKPEILEAVAKAYPDFDSSKIKGYQDTYKNFTSGKTSVELKSGGTALGHLLELRNLNTAASHIPHTPAWTKYQNKVDTLATELSKFYGDTTVPAIASIKETLASTLPGNRDAAISTQAQSMSDKMNSLEQEWVNAAPSKVYQAPMPGLSLQAKQARAQLDPNYAAQHPELGVKAQQPDQQTAPVDSSDPFSQFGGKKR